MSNNKYTISYNSMKNRIYIILSDTLNEQDAASYVQDLKPVVDKSKPGFTICLDASNCGVLSPKVDEILGEARKYCVMKGIKATATVIGSSAIFKLQAKRTLAEVGNDLVATVADADTYLDSLQFFEDCFLQKLNTTIQN